MARNRNRFRSRRRARAARAQPPAQRRGSTLGLIAFSLMVVSLIVASLILSLIAVSLIVRSARRTVSIDRLILPTLLDDPRPVAERDCGASPPPGKSPGHEIVADGGDLLDQLLAGHIIPAVNGVGVGRACRPSCRIRYRASPARGLTSLPDLRALVRVGLHFQVCAEFPPAIDISSRPRRGVRDCQGDERAEPDPRSTRRFCKGSYKT